MKLNLLGNLPNFEGIFDVTLKWSNLVLGVLAGLVTLFVAWKIITIIISVIKNSDNPEARAKDISAIKWPLIMLIALLVLIAIMNIIIPVIKAYQPALVG